MQTNKFYYKNNRLQQLRGFYNVARLGSVSKAGEKMGLVQSAISLQIKYLQDDLGVKLFENKNGKIHLTETGVKFYKKVFPIVEQTDNLFKEFWKGYEAENESKVSLAMHHAVASAMFPKHIGKFLESFPESKLKISNISRPEAFERIQNGEIDLAIYPCSVYEDFPAELEASPFLDYNICILVPKENALAALEDTKITLDEIMKNRLLYEDEKLMTSSKLINTFKENNIGSAIEFENANWEIISTLCKVGIGIAGFDEIYCKSIQTENMVIKSISHLLPKMSYFFFTRKNQSVKSSVLFLKKLFV